MSNGISRRTVLRSLGAAVAAPLLGSAVAGCGSDESAGGGSGGGGGGKKLTFIYMGEAAQQKQWQALFDQFRKSNPDITLEANGLALNNWADFVNQVASRIAGGQVPDMVQIATEGQRLLASKGLLHPLDEFIAKDKALIDEYYADCDPHLIEWSKKYGSPDGKTYYLPGEFNTMVMWCQKDVFAKAGVELPGPKDEWTWDEFYTAAKAIKTKTGAFAYHCAPEYFVSVMPWLLTNGASSLDADWAKPTIASPEAIEAAEFCRKLVQDQLSPPPGGEFDEPTQFAQGKLAVLGRGRWGIIDLQGVKAVDKAQIVRWPKKQKLGSPVGWNGYPILKSSQNKEAAWEFAKFLISKPGVEFFAQQGGTIVPARRSVATGPAFLKGAPEGTELLYDALSYATPIPSPDRGAEVQKTIEDGWQQILAGNVPAADGLTKMAQTLSGML